MAEVGLPKPPWFLMNSMNTLESFWELTMRDIQMPAASSKRYSTLVPVPAVPRTMMGGGSV